MSIGNLYSRSRCASTSKNRVKITSLVDGCDLILQLGQNLLPQSTSETHHPQNCTAAAILVILTPYPCVYTSVNMGPTRSTTCDIQNPIWLHAQHWQIQIHWQQQTVWGLSSHAASCTHAMFTGSKKMRAYPNLDMYDNFYLDVAPYNTNPTVYFGRLTSNQKKWITALWSCLDRFTTWCTLFKLHGNLVHSSYPLTQWYHSI
jgi:hypothetical protein